MDLVRCSRDIEMATLPGEKVLTKGEFETAEWVARRVDH
jgi:hypothetical protein